MEGSDRGLL